MFLPLGLTRAQHGQLIDTLLTHHSIRVRLQIQNLNGDSSGPDLAPMLLSGAVNIDWSAAITRSCTLSLLDPGRTLSFDSDSPSDAALYMDRQIAVWYDVNVGGVWREIPVFTGPITSMDRDDAVVNLECQGKEILAMGSAMTTRTFKKGKYRVDVIREILGDLTGETQFDFPESKNRLPADLSIGRESVPWAVARHISAGLNMQLFYDGAGTARLRPLPGNALFTFKDGDPGTSPGAGSVITSPQVTYTTDNVKNTVMVKAHVGTGKNTHAISPFVTAPRNHPLSPWRLGRNGVPRFLLEVIEESTTRTAGEATALAKTHLENLLLQQVEVAFDAAVIPMVEPGDMYRITTDQLNMAFRLTQASIPLVVADGQGMSIGYLKNVSPHVRRKRR